ncbi:MAG: chromate transporter [Oscillospiraceae bacterium]|nr:chromate transporter [Oscillospiraceae bacterium]
MKKNASLTRLFWTSFSISALTFGGGYVIVSLLRKQFVDKHGWMTDDEMLDILAISQSCPGVIAVNATFMAGYRLRGAAGAAAAVIGCIIPPFGIIFGLSFFYTAVKDSPAVRGVFRGLLAGVAAVIADVVVTMTTPVIKAKKVLPIVIMFAAFVANFVFNWNPAFIILFTAALGIALQLARFFRRKMAQGTGDR